MHWGVACRNASPERMPDGGCRRAVMADVGTPPGTGVLQSGYSRSCKAHQSGQNEEQRAGHGGRVGKHATPGLNLRLVSLPVVRRRIRRLPSRFAGMYLQAHPHRPPAAHSAPMDAVPAAPTCRVAIPVMRGSTLAAAHQAHSPACNGVEQRPDNSWGTSELAPPLPMPLPLPMPPLQVARNTRSTAAVVLAENLRAAKRDKQVRERALHALGVSHDSVHVGVCRCFTAPPHQASSRLVKPARACQVAGTRHGVVGPRRCCRLLQAAAGNRSVCGQRLPRVHKQALGGCMDRRRQAA